MCRFFKYGICPLIWNLRITKTWENSWNPCSGYTIDWNVGLLNGGRGEGAGNLWGFWFENSITLISWIKAPKSFPPFYITCKIFSDSLTWFYHIWHKKPFKSHRMRPTDSDMDEPQITNLFGYKMEFFSFQNNAKNLDPSCKMDLDLWDCLGM